MNRAETSLKCDLMQEDKHRYELKTVIMPMRNASNNSCGPSTQRGNVEQTTTNRQAIGAPIHSYSSDSDGVSNTITASTATAMRRLYFKSAKLSKTTQNSITTVHQQQSQHVPKVNEKMDENEKNQKKNV